MNRYFHVAGPDWRPGADLVCYAELERAGRAPDWKWGASPYAAADRDVVCLFTSLLEAVSFRDEFGGRIVAVDLGAAPELSLVIVDEGYPAVADRIPARCLRLVAAAEVEAEL